MHVGSGAAEASEGFAVRWFACGLVGDFNDSWREIRGEVDVRQGDGRGADVVDVCDRLGVVCMSLCL